MITPAFPFILIFPLYPVLRRVFGSDLIGDLPSVNHHDDARNHPFGPCWDRTATFAWIGRLWLAPQCQFTSADRDDLPPRRTKTLMALPDTHPYFVVLSHSCVALSRLCCDTWSSFLFNYEAVCSFELGALRLASPVALDVSACFRCSFPSFSHREIKNWLGNSFCPELGFVFASWTRQLLGYGIDLRTFWNPGRPLPESNPNHKVDPYRSRTRVLRILS